MNNNMTKTSKQSFFSRFAIPLMVLVFIAPMVAAWIVYNYFPGMVRTLNASNHGEFVIPPVEVSLEGLTDIDGNAIDKDYFLKNWSYVYIRQQCDEDCLNHLAVIKNVRLTQGKEISRLHRILVLTKPGVSEELRKNLQQFPGMLTIVLTDAAQQEKFLQAFKFKDNTEPESAKYIYIVDPDAMLMMYYQDKEDILALGKDMQKDMSKLMYNSKLRK
jgi:hypothetical protein